MPAFDEEDIRKLVQSLNDPSNPGRNAEARRVLRNALADPDAGLSQAMADEVRRVLIGALTFNAAGPEILSVQLYRSSPGDLEIQDVSFSEECDALEVARARLQSHFDDQRITGRAKPLQARVMVLRTGELLHTLRISPRGTAEVVR